MTANGWASMDQHTERATRLRWLGVGAAIASAALYVLIGIGWLTVGESTQEATTDLFGFGVLMGGVYAVTALALWFMRTRVVIALIAAFQLIPLLGYVAFAGLREPPFEPWGVLIKVCQVVVLVAAVALVLRSDHRAHEAMARPNPKGHAA
jgi:uncharacterized membrane-anchored protein